MSFQEQLLLPLLLALWTILLLEDCVVGFVVIGCRHKYHPMNKEQAIGRTSNHNHYNNHYNNNHYNNNNNNLHSSSRNEEQPFSLRNQTSSSSSSSSSTSPYFFLTDKNRIDLEQHNNKKKTGKTAEKQNNQKDNDDATPTTTTSTSTSTSTQEIGGTCFVLPPMVPSCFHPTKYKTWKPKTTTTANSSSSSSSSPSSPATTTTTNKQTSKSKLNNGGRRVPRIPMSFWKTYYHQNGTLRSTGDADDTDENNHHTHKKQQRRSLTRGTKPSIKTKEEYMWVRPIPRTKQIHQRQLYELQLLESLRHSDDALPKLRALWKYERQQEQHNDHPAAQSSSLSASWSNQQERLEAFWQQQEVNPSLSYRDRQVQLLHVIENTPQGEYLEPILQLAQLYLNQTTDQQNQQPNQTTTTTTTTSTPSPVTPRFATSKSPAPPPPSSVACEAVHWCLVGLRYKPWHFDLVDVLVKLSLRRKRLDHAVYWTIWYALPPLNPHKHNIKRNQWVDRAIVHAKHAMAQSAMAKEYILLQQQEEVEQGDNSQHHDDDDHHHHHDGTPTIHDTYGVLTQPIRGMPHDSASTNQNQSTICTSIWE